MSPDLLRHGAVGGQDNAFNQLSVPLPLLLLSSDEVKGTYFCLPDSFESQKEFAFTFGFEGKVAHKEANIMSL